MVQSYAIALAWVLLGPACGGDAEDGVADAGDGVADAETTDADTTDVDEACATVLLVAELRTVFINPVQQQD
jgi:hypothetical protein